MLHNLPKPDFSAGFPKIWLLTHPPQSHLAPSQTPKSDTIVLEIRSHMNMSRARVVLTPSGIVYGCISNILSGGWLGFTSRHSITPKSEKLLTGSSQTQVNQLVEIDLTKIKSWEIQSKNRVLGGYGASRVETSHPQLKIFEIYPYTMSEVVRTTLARNMFKGGLISSRILSDFGVWLGARWVGSGAKSWEIQPKNQVLGGYGASRVETKSSAAQNIRNTFIYDV